MSRRLSGEKRPKGEKGKARALQGLRGASRRASWSATKIDGGSMNKADEGAIRAIESRFNEAWGRHDADGMVESLADDAQFVTVNGARRQLWMCAFWRR